MFFAQFALICVFRILAHSSIGVSSHVYRYLLSVVPKSVLELTEDYCDECMIGGLGQDLKVASLLVLLSDCDDVKAKYSDDFSMGAAEK